MTTGTFMNSFIIPELTIPWLVVGFGCWLGWQLLRQNGRILLRLEALEQHLTEWELASEPGGNGKSHSLARSRLTRDGLRAGTPAPNFRLPRVDGGELTLEEFRGRRVLLVFSDPECGPCNQLAPQLERFHRNDPEPALVLISRREPKANRAKVKEHGLTFPVVVQQHWEISLLYGMFATPIAYLIDERGMIVNDVAVGVEPILALLSSATQNAKKRSGCPRELFDVPLRAAPAAGRRFSVDSPRE
jgi:peroxiredoxin